MANRDPRSDVAGLMINLNRMLKSAEPSCQYHASSASRGFCVRHEIKTRLARYDSEWEEPAIPP